MKRTLLSVSLLSLLTFGCGHTLMQPPTHELDAAEAKKGSATAIATSLDVPDGTASESAPADLRQAGDFIKYRFSGSYRDAPVTVTYQVVSRIDSILTLDVTLDADGKQQQFRLQMSDEPSGPSEIIFAARLEGKNEHPINIATYEALMAKTMAPIEHNDARIESKKTRVDIGAQSFDCTRSAYRVIAAGSEATMTVLESQSFAWGDLGGEITGDGGETIYKAEVVDVSASAANSAQAVAAQTDEDIFADWDDFE